MLRLFDISLYTSKACPAPIATHSIALSTSKTGTPVSLEISFCKPLSIEPNKEDPIDVLSKVGGFDIGGMCGLYLSAAKNKKTETTVEKLLDYIFNTPQDPLRSVECVAQRCDLIKKNLAYLGKK